MENLPLRYLLATLFSASLEEMKLAGESVEGSVELIEGGYLASTSVYHDLHCLVSCDPAYPAATKLNQKRDNLGSMCIRTPTISTLQNHK
jgi:hypothetical protein